jgi:hypothetical protein
MLKEYLMKFIAEYRCCQCGTYHATKWLYPDRVKVVCACGRTMGNNDFICSTHDYADAIDREYAMIVKREGRQ